MSKMIKITKTPRGISIRPLTNTEYRMRFGLYMSNTNRNNQVYPTRDGSLVCNSFIFN